VVAAVDGVVEGLREADGDGFEEGEGVVEWGEFEVGVVEEVVGDAVDVPGDADRINKPETDEPIPFQMQVRKGEEEKDQVGKVGKSRQHRNDIEPGIGEEF
jgi:hypothetical protein